MRIAVTGASGLLGSALISMLSARGDNIMRFVRRLNQMGHDAIFWNAEEHRIESTKLEGLDAVIHLAGEPVAQRWNQQVKYRIRHSRVDSTRFLCEYLAKQKNPPTTLICASAIGYYGSGYSENESSDSRLVESSSQGNDFLAHVVSDWEAATMELKQTKTRVIHMRLGMVLSQEGGALKKMLPAFRFGLGARFGTGEQWMSWISQRDVLTAINHLLENEKLHGAFNLVSPTPVINADFTRILGEVLKRPTFLRFPEPFLKFIFGEMAEQILLANQRVFPDRLLASGFNFQDTNLKEALEHLLIPTPDEQT